MEEKKFDINSIIGFVLIGGILLWMLYLNQPTEEEIQAEKVRTEVAAQEKAAAEAAQSKDITIKEAVQNISAVSMGDSLSLEKLKNRLGSFAYSGTLPSATGNTTVIENDVLSLTISNKGGYIKEARLKQHTTYDSVPVYLIKDGNASLNLQFSAENRLLNSKDLFFEP
jgi:YidC/Oxa1 family membrane protein insertase